MTDKHTNESEGNALERLIKVMRMTEAEDNVALVAIRKANKVVTDLGGWEKLLRGKVRVIADPFSSPTAPVVPDSHTRPQDMPPPPPRRPQPTATSNIHARPRPRPSTPPPSAAPLAVHFRSWSGKWAIASTQRLRGSQTVDVTKKNGKIEPVIVGGYLGEMHGEFYYQFQSVSTVTRSATSRSARANRPGIDDLLM